MKKKLKFLNFSKLLLAMCILPTLLMLTGCDDLDVILNEAYENGYEDGYENGNANYTVNENSIETTNTNIAIPEENYEIEINGEIIEWYSGEPYIEINNNQPFFTKNDHTKKAFEKYTELDELGRCGVAYANICQELMPTEDRGKIGHIKPSGWHTIKYDFVDGKYLYNRCHLVGFQLAGENDNEKNLITGTRYLNIQGMLDHENMIAEYVKETNNHVLYRVTPIYIEDNLVASGVLMEGYSVEDKGKGICFNIFAYNVQPGAIIDYKTGESYSIEGGNPNNGTNTFEGKKYTANEDGIVYVVNTNSKKYHYEDCENAKDIKEANRESFNGTTEWLNDNGYKPCGVCKPE